MSASTRTAQQPLGISQLGAALIVVALAIAIAVAVALGSMGTKPAVSEAGAGAAVPEISVGVPPDARDHGWNAAIPQISVGVPPDARDQGSSNSGAVITDTRGGFNGDPGLAPRGNEKTRVPGLRPE